MKHLTQVLIAVLLPVLFLTGCWQGSITPDDGAPPAQSADSSAPAQQTAALPKELTLSYYPNQSLDPVTCPDGAQQTVAALLYEGLFALDDHLAAQPQLCASYSYDPPALTYTFTLRSGVLFSDGTSLTAGDVAATLNRARNSERYGTRLAQITAVKAADSAVQVTLSAPNTNLPALLDIPIVKTGTQNDAVPIGTGPYCFVSDDTGTYLTTNTHWWKGGKQPVSRIALLSAQDPDILLYQFSSHETQLMTADLTGAASISVTGSITFHEADTSILQYVGINVRRPLLAQPAVRAALNLGIDRTQVVSAFFSGHGKATQFPVSPSSAEYPSALAQRYSHDTFTSAMTDAGCSSGGTRTLTMIVNQENSFKVSAAQQIADALSVFDLKIQVKVLPWEEYKAALEAGNFDLFYGEVKLTADWNLAPLLSTGGALNYGGFSDPELDALLSSYASASNHTGAMKAICTLLQTQAPILPICFKTTSVLVQDGVIDDLTPTAENPFYNFTACTVHLAGS